jgi:hypothetical protein
LHDAFAGVPRVYVNRADNDISNTCAKYRICAWSSAPCCRARLQSNEQRGARGHGRTEIAETLNLSVIATRFPMVPFRYYSIVYDQNRSNSRIRARLAERLLCLVQRSAHELLVAFGRHCFEINNCFSPLRQRAGMTHQGDDEEFSITLAPSKLLIADFSTVRPSGLLRGVSAGTIYNCDQSRVVLRWAIIEDKA